MAERPKRAPKTRLHSPPKPSKLKVPDDVKVAVAGQAEQLLAEWRPRYIKPTPPDYRFNYIIELYGKWFRGYFYLCAKYACPKAAALSPFFEALFTRLEHVGEWRFNLAFMRHTGQWVETGQGLTLDQCLKSIKEDEMYRP
jgi:hypothetical protein